MGLAGPRWSHSGLLRRVNLTGTGTGDAGAVHHPTLLEPAAERRPGRSELQMIASRVGEHMASTCNGGCC